MRIAVIGSRGYPSTYGGFETFVRVLAPFLVERGHAVTVYGRSDSLLHRRRDVDGVGVVDTLGVDSTALSTLSHGATAAIDATIRGFDCALVLNVANGPFLPLLWVRRIPTLVNVDGIEWEREKWSGLGKRVFLVGAALAARVATEVVADSECIADTWSERFHRRPIFIPYGACLTTPVSPVRIQALGLSPGAYVLVVARIAPENNVDLVLDAFEGPGLGAPLVVVGTSNYDSPTQVRLQRLHDAGAIQWLGHVSDQALLADLWHYAGVYIHGHSVGGTNPALLQALGCGTPTLVYPSRFNIEVVGDRAHAFEPTPQGLAHSVRTVMADEDVRLKLSANGLSRIAESYSWADVCQKYEDALAAIAEIGRSHPTG